MSFSERTLSASSRRWLALLVSLAAGIFAAGCQSCQGTKEVPSAKQEMEAAPAAEEPGTVITLHSDGLETGDEDDEDALVLLAEGEPEEGTAPLTVEFVVESLVEEEMNGPKYTWEFGDGTPNSNEASPTHVFEKPGSYTVTIRIVDANGLRGWDEVDVEVEEP